MIKKKIDALAHYFIAAYFHFELESGPKVIESRVAEILGGRREIPISWGGGGKDLRIFRGAGRKLSPAPFP